MEILGIPPWSRAVDFFGVSGDQMQKLDEGNRLPEFCSMSCATMPWIIREDPVSMLYFVTRYI